MKTRILAAVCAMAALLPATESIAAERRARIIGEADVVFREYDAMRVVGVSALEEYALQFDDDWSVVAGIGAGRISSGNTSTPWLWSVGLGAKRHFLDVNDVQLLISGDWCGSGEDYMVVGGTLSLSHRFMPDESSCVPFVTAGISVFDAKATTWVGATDRFMAMVLQGAIGCNFAMGNDYELTTKISVFDSSDLSDSALADYADGWSANIGLKYFFSHK